MKFCQQNATTAQDDDRSYQFRICGQRVRTKKRLAKWLLELPYPERSEALYFAKKLHDLGVDLRDLKGLRLEIKRAGVLFNQSVKLAHQDRAPGDYNERLIALAKAVEAVTS